MQVKTTYIMHTIGLYLKLKTHPYFDIDGFQSFDEGKVKVNHNLRVCHCVHTCSKTRGGNQGKEQEFNI